VAGASHELHTHIVDGDVMRMVHVEEGFALPAGGEVLLERGGKHLMFMGLDAQLQTGETVSATLVFEQAGEITVDIPVDNDRMPAAMMDHGGMDHGDMDHGTMDHGSMGDS
jgi:Uncharacterized protein conserved in bacteria